MPLHNRCWVHFAYWNSLVYNSRRMNEPENARRTIMGLSWYSHACTHGYAYECPERHRRISYQRNIYIFVWLCATQWRDKPPNVHDGLISCNTSCFPMYDRTETIGNRSRFKKQLEVIYVQHNCLSFYKSNFEICDHPLLSIFFVIK